MVVKGTSTNKTIIILDNIKDSNLLSDLKFFGAIETKKTKKNTFFKFNRNKKYIQDRLSWDVQEIAEAYTGKFIAKDWRKNARCNWCGCFLGNLHKEYVIGNTCRECYELFEKKYEEECV